MTEELYLSYLNKSSKMGKNNLKSMNKQFKTNSHVLYPRLTQNV